MRAFYVLLSFGLLLFAITSCGGGSSSSDSKGSSPSSGDSASSFNNFVEETVDASLPKFKGVSLAYSSTPNSIELAWVEAVDASTTRDAMGYKIYLSKNDSTYGDLVKDKNLIHTVWALDSYTLENLEADTTYYIAVVAVNKNKKTNTPTVVSEIKTISTNFNLSKTPKDLSGNQNLTITKNTANEFLVTGDSTIEYHDIVIIDSDDDSPSLKKVESLTVGDHATTIVVSNATLDEFIENGVIQSVTTMENVSTLANAGKKTGKVVYEHSSGSFITEGMGIPEAKRHKESADDFTVTTELSTGVKVGCDINFEPSVSTKIEFGYFSLKAFEVKAIGTFTLDAFLELNLSSAKEAKKTVELEAFKVKKILLYFVGGLPVYQEVFINFFAEIDLKATGVLAARKRLQAKQEVGIGFRYNSTTDEFEAFTDSNLSKKIQFEIDNTAGVEASFKVYPVISTRFYKAARSSIYLVAEVGAKAEATSTFLPVPANEFTKFDIAFSINTYASVSLEIFSITLASGKTNTYDLFRQPFFSLHSLEFSRNTQVTTVKEVSEFELKITDGENNKVTSEGITWEIIDSNGDKVPAKVNLSNGNKKASITIETPGAYIVFARAEGNGFLGALGKRGIWAVLVVEPEKPADSTDGKEENKTVSYKLANDGILESYIQGQWVNMGVLTERPTLIFDLTIKDGVVTQANASASQPRGEAAAYAAQGATISNERRTFSNTSLGNNSFKIIETYSFTVTQSYEGQQVSYNMVIGTELTTTFASNLESITINGAITTAQIYEGVTSSARIRYSNATGTILK